MGQLIVGCSMKERRDFLRMGLAICFYICIVTSIMGLPVVMFTGNLVVPAILWIAASIGVWTIRRAFIQRRPWSEWAVAGFGGLIALGSAVSAFFCFAQATSVLDLVGGAFWGLFGTFGAAVALLARSIGEHGKRCG
ncbi:MAG: hypothetical protein MUF48_11335, partial [Pirellulaceae bacterium]|nr:hypothetical protein [Pirellulaceae bacterium]